MSIYKPSNNKPYLDAVDLDQLPLFLECKIDSSNTRVDGYSIKIYDENNNLVFPAKEPGELDIDQITLISDLKAYYKRMAYSEEGYDYLNEGINGTYLRIPFAVEDGVATDTMRHNSIYVSPFFTFIGKDKNGQDTQYTDQIAKYYIQQKDDDVFVGQTKIVIPMSFNNKPVFVDNVSFTTGLEDIETIEFVSFISGSYVGSGSDGCFSSADKIIIESEAGSNAFEGDALLNEYAQATVPSEVISKIVKRSLESVIINGGTEIPQDAFENCTTLTSITIPNSITKINSGAFDGCTGITNFSMTNISDIGSRAFNGCSGLQSITFMNCPTEIGADAFYGCTNLQSVYIVALSQWLSIDFINVQSNPLSYGANLYVNGQIAEEINIGSKIKEIKDYAFYGCRSLTRVRFGEDSNCKTIGESAFEECELLQGIIIPDGVEKIKQDAFKNCTTLTSITIPNSIKRINAGAFDGCQSLETTDEGTVKYIGNSTSNTLVAIDGVGNDDGLYEVTNKCKIIYKCSGLTPDIHTIWIYPGVVSITDGAFDDCQFVTKIKFNDDGGALEYIGANSFVTAELSETEGALYTDGDVSYWYGGDVKLNADDVKSQNLLQTLKTYNGSILEQRR